MKQHSGIVQNYKLLMCIPPYKVMKNTWMILARDEWVQNVLVSYFSGTFYFIGSNGSAFRDYIEQ